MCVILSEADDCKDAGGRMTQEVKIEGSLLPRYQVVMGHKILRLRSE